MKGKLPSYSSEEKEKLLKSVKVGDTIICIETWGLSKLYYIKECKVIKITPKGSVRLDNGELLKTLSYNYYIDSPEVRNWVKTYKIKEGILKNVSDLYRSSNKLNLLDNLEDSELSFLSSVLKKVNKSVMEGK